MILKMFLTVLAILTITTFSGCSGRKPIVQYVDRLVEVKVPVKCKMSEVQCDFKGAGAEPAVKAFECISNQKRAMEVCR